METKRIDTVVIGAGQAGLAVGYYLTRYGKDFVILEAGQHVGEAWRDRWDNLRLFTPASLNRLPGMPFPARGGYFPTKDEMADFLEAYAARFQLPLRLGVRVHGLHREAARYVITTGERRLEANQVVVATGAYAPQNCPRLPTSSTLRSTSSIPSHIATPASYAKVLCSSSGRAIQAPRSHWMFRHATGLGSPAATPDTLQPTSGALAIELGAASFRP